MVCAVLIATLLGLANAAPQQLSRAELSSHGAPTAKVKNGTIVGRHQATYNQDYFLGVPFAQPPTGENRFRIPQSINTTFKGNYQATEYAPECVGYGGDQIGYPVDEDCLYLNVVRPSGYENQKLPVGVWIHGGGLSEGGTRDERYNLSFIVDNSAKIDKPFIGISIAYRLSVWGFLASQEVSGSGNTNLGLRDQRLALHWIQENIAAFGGDPSKVTIWGESAGAASVGWHLTAYNGRDDKLFRAGIMESGNPVSYNGYRDNEYYQPLYNSIVKAAGGQHETDTLAYLRTVPFDKLNSIFNQTKYQTTFFVVVDGDIVARYNSIQLAEGDFVKVPVISGANTDEGNSFGPSPIKSAKNFVKQATSKSSSNALPKFLSSQLLKAYPVTPDYFIPPPEEVPANATFPSSYGNSEQYRRSAAYFGDVVFIANRRGTVETWAAHGIPAYSYRFNTVPNGLSYYVGVAHFQEVAFVFDNTQGLGYNAAHGTVNPYGHEPKSYLHLGKLMSQSWASFIHDLNPNNFTGRHAQADDWPMYDQSKPQNIVWDANTTQLAYAEPDTFRKEGIQFILDHNIAYHR